MPKLLLTGGCGSVGHHIVEGILKNTNWDIIILDSLNYAGSLERLRDIKIWEKEKNRVQFVWHDLKSEISKTTSKIIGEVDYVWHLAGGTHVDRSIADPMSFVMDNVAGTTNLLLWAKTLKLKQFIYFSTDEVFGPAPEKVCYDEEDRHHPGNPYAATKAGAEDMCVAFENTFKMPIIITHCMNIVGERQHPEKFIPSTIKKVLTGDTVIIHSNKDKTKAGSRFYIHSRNVCDALLFLTKKGISGEKYNIVGEKEVDNLELAKFIAKIVGKPLIFEMTDFHSSRPGHDLRYALSGDKMKDMGWRIPKTFEESLTKTIKWYLKNKKWLNL